jgi:hypothetical protein
MTLTVFKAKARDPETVQIGDEVVDLSRISMRTLATVLELVGDDPGEIDGADITKVIGAIAALCEPSNPKVTADYLLDLDAYEEVIPFMKFAIGVVRDRGGDLGGLVDPKNPTPSSTPSRE